MFDGKYVTAAGVSSGIDMGLTLLGRIAGDEHAQAVQLLTEYDPQPPYDAGSPEKAPGRTSSRSSGRRQPSRRGESAAELSVQVKRGAPALQERGDPLRGVAAAARLLGPVGVPVRAAVRELLRRGLRQLRARRPAPG